VRYITIKVQVPETFEPSEDLDDVRDAAQSYVNAVWAEDIEQDREDGRAVPSDGEAQEEP
jgi:hypothetical protein